MKLASIVLAASMALSAEDIGKQVHGNPKSPQQAQSKPFFPLEIIEPGPYKTVKLRDGTEKILEYRWVISQANFDIGCYEPVQDEKSSGYVAQTCTIPKQNIRVIGLKIPPIESKKIGIEGLIDRSSPIAVFYDHGQNGFGKEDRARFFLDYGGVLVSDYTLGWKPKNGNRQLQSWNIHCPLPGQQKEHHDNHSEFVTWMVYGQIKKRLEEFTSLENAGYINPNTITGITERMRERSERRFKSDLKDRRLRSQSMPCIANSLQ